ncbi:MAG: DUF1905 domain-containing protein, partial [Sphingomicrobium sp.]
GAGSGPPAPDDVQEADPVAAGVITFASSLWIWTGEGAGRWHFLTVPENQSAEIHARAFESRRGFGSVKVEATIADVTWRTSVFPLKAGGYLLPVKAKVRKEAALSVGDEVTVRLTLLD